MKKYYTIGETAKLMDMSTKALRNYDRIDLLKPSYLDPITKYRYYTYDQFFTIDTIKYLNKVLYIPLENIKSILSFPDDYKLVCQQLGQHRQTIKQQMAKYEYALQLVNNIMEDIINRNTIPPTDPKYEVYLMSRDFYYVEMDSSLEEVDQFINRSLPEFIHTQNRENDTISLVFSHEEFKQTGAIIIRGFGLFSDQRIPGLKMKKFEEGRYLIHRFNFSEDASRSALLDMTDYANTKDMKLGDCCILTSKSVDLTARSKYDYDIELQMFHHLE